MAGVGIALTALAGSSPQDQVLAGFRRPAAAEPARPTPSPTPAPVVIGTAAPRSFDPLSGQLAALQSASDARISVSLIELGGANPQGWNFQGDDAFVAASTYKLPVLMAEAELMAAGKAGPDDQICYALEDWEDGWFDDYQPGACYSRADLAQRVGQDSDNTAAHMLVRSLGGASALNAYASAHGARASAFFDPNTTTANDLARLMAAEATGQAGGDAAQAWLYPLLLHTAFEGGIPAGVPAGLVVVHKTGELDSVTNDVALVLGGANGAYVLAICVDGPGGDAGMGVVALVSSLIWQMESSR